MMSMIVVRIDQEIGKWKKGRKENKKVRIYKKFPQRWDLANLTRNLFFTHFSFDMSDNWQYTNVELYMN